MSIQKQLFVVTAESRESRLKIQFMIEESSHRDAWKAARQAAKTGRGALLREPHSQELQEFALVPDHFTVNRVLSAGAHRRGRPPKITTDDLLELAEQRGVRVPRRVRHVIEELVHDAAA